MKFSVVIPCHNAAEYIADALASVAAQSHSPHEIIVVDDRSQDDSASRAMETGVPTTLMRVDFGNAAAARNAGIQAATGDWLAFLDADNRWYPHHLYQAFELLARTTDVAFMAAPGMSEGWSPEDGQRTWPAPVHLPTNGLDHVAFIRIRLERGYGFPTTGQILRADVVRHVGAFDATQVRRHDFELFMRVIHGRTWAFHPRPSWWIRPPRPGDISSDEVKCRYYALRAMKLNESRYRSPMMDQVLCKDARMAVVAAMMAGTLADIQRAWQLAAPYLTWRDRCVLGGGRLVPGLFRAVYARRSRRTRLAGTS